MKFVDIKNDIAFRKIFGNENKKEILVSFLNAVLKLENQYKIQTITLLNPFQFPRIQGLKVTVIDVKATDERGNIFIIESHCQPLLKKQCIFNGETNFVGLFQFTNYFSQTFILKLQNTCFIRNHIGIFSNFF